jgi:hypothetical protein
LAWLLGMSREERAQYVIQLYKENKSIREIAKLMHMSFRDIGAITKKLKLVLQVQYMIDSRNGGSLVYSNVCGLMVYRYMIKRLELGKWQAMDGVITKAPLGGKRYRCKSYRQS